MASCGVNLEGHGPYQQGQNMGLERPVLLAAPAIPSLLTLPHQELLQKARFLDDQARIPRDAFLKLVETVFLRLILKNL